MCVLNVWVNQQRNHWLTVALERIVNKKHELEDPQSVHPPSPTYPVAYTCTCTCERLGREVFSLWSPSLWLYLIGQWVYGWVGRTKDSDSEYRNRGSWKIQRKKSIWGSTTNLKAGQAGAFKKVTFSIEKLIKTLKVLSPLVWCKWKSKIELQNFISYLPYFVILFCNSLHQALLFHFVEAEKSRLQGEKGLVLAHLSCRHKGQTRMLIWWSSVPKNRSQWSLRPQKVLSPHAWGAFRRRQMEEKVRPVFTIGLWLIEGFPGQKWVLHIFE